jgi:hypothetical protein
MLQHLMSYYVLMLQKVHQQNPAAAVPVGRLLVMIRDITGML